MDFVTSAIRGVLSQLSSIIQPTPDNTPVATSPDPVSTIIKIALLLRFRLPADLVPVVLDHAELWVPIATATSLRQDVDKISQTQSPKLQVALTVPKAGIRRVRFTIVSRDQGWSSYGKDHGTYNGSWTWFEAGVRGLHRDRHVPEQAERETSDQAQLLILGDVLCTHRNALDEDHKLRCEPHVQFYKYGSKELMRNVHAGHDFKEHVIEWSVDHPDDDIARTVRELKRGCRIEVAAHARFPGWVNYVKSVKIEAEGMAVRRM